MLTRAKFFGITAAIAVVGFSISSVIGFHAHERAKRSDAAWLEVFGSVREMVDKSDVIVVARAGQSTPSRTAYSDTGEDDLPFEAIEFSVHQGLKGILNVGSKLVVERAGGMHLDGTPAEIDADGGAFEEGKLYLLFLKWQPGGPFLYQINHQARYEIVGRDVIAAEPDDDVAVNFHGKTLGDVVAMIKG